MHTITWTIKKKRRYPNNFTPVSLQELIHKSDHNYMQFIPAITHEKRSYPSSLHIDASQILLRYRYPNSFFSDNLRKSVHKGYPRRFIPNDKIDIDLTSLP